MQSFRLEKKPKIDLICTKCGNQTKFKKVTPGSIFIELILWICFIVPGLIYSIWRLSSKYLACALCGSRELVPLKSPMGIQLQTQLQHIK